MDLPLTHVLTYNRRNGILKVIQILYGIPVCGKYNALECMVFRRVQHLCLEDGRIVIIQGWLDEE